jgi:hypothetical protein
MDKLSFNEAMEFLYSHPTHEKRKLNKLLRDHYKDKIGARLSVKEADPYVQRFMEIRRQCIELAAENFHSNNKSDFQARIFDKYPTISSELKNKWIQESYFAAFR